MEQENFHVIRAYIDLFAIMADSTTIMDDNTTLIRVIAPATLKEGYSFDVMVNDEPFTVYVPKGGVKEGQEFMVPYAPNVCKNKEDDEEEQQTLPIGESNSQEDDHDELGAPYGRWRRSVFSCCDVLTQATFWMGWCCTPVLIAQLLTRLRLTWQGYAASKEESALSFNRIVLSMIFILGLAQIPVLGGFLIAAYYIVVLVIIGSNVRRSVRNKYRIPPTIKLPIVGDRLDDGCCMLWCSCCSAIQMARHTHDDKDYPGFGCTTTGLEVSAPEVP